MSIVMRHIQGTEGQVELAGARAVVAMFYKWTCERREDSPSDQPSWNLRASLSYQKDSYLTGERWKKNIKLKWSETIWYEAQPSEGAAFEIENGSLIIKGVTLCRVDTSPKRP